MTRHEKLHKQWLASIGCQVCVRLYGEHDPGEVQLHHLRGNGWGKGSYMTLIPLCHAHHQGPEGVHGLGTREFERRYGFTQSELLRDVLTMRGEI